MDGTIVSLDAVRSATGASRVAMAIEEVRHKRRHGAVAIDAETDSDIDTIARGIALAWEHRLEFVVRCAPALGAAMAGATAPSMIDVPKASRLLVLCGSFVDRTSRQLAQLGVQHPDVLLNIDAAAAEAHPSDEGHRLARHAETLLESRSIAVVATPRIGARRHGGRRIGACFTETLATVAGDLQAVIDLLIIKGGATSVAVVADGLGADVVEGVGPVGHGATLWRVPTTPSALATIVVPGNVGGDDALLRLVNSAREVRAC